MNKSQQIIGFLSIVFGNIKKKAKENLSKNKKKKEKKISTELQYC